MALAKPRLTYFSARGLCEPIRLVLAEAGVDFEDLGFGTTVDGKQPELLLKLKAEGKLMFDQVPLWEEVDGFSVTQSSAILRHVARVHGLSGKSEHETTIADAVFEYIIDVRNNLYGVVRQADPVKKAEGKQILIDVEFPKFLARLELLLTKSKTGFFAGPNLTYADLGVWYMLENLSEQHLLDVSKYDHVAKFKKDIESSSNRCRRVDCLFFLTNVGFWISFWT